MISDRKQYIGIKNNIVFELFQFLFMLEWFLACISHFSAHIPTSFSVFMPNICCLDKLDNKHYAYRLIMMWEYGQKNEKYWPGSIPAHIRIGKVLNVVIFDTNNCLFWITGPTLPFPVLRSAMAESPDGKGVLLFGGEGEIQDRILELRAGDSSCYILNITLQNKKGYHIVIPLL